MQNFGRGMWRRVGDYNRMQEPFLLQQSRIQKLEQFIQYQNMLKHQKNLCDQQKPPPRPTFRARNSRGCNASNCKHASLRTRNHRTRLAFNAS